MNGYCCQKAAGIRFIIKIVCNNKIANIKVNVGSSWLVEYVSELL